MIKAVGRYVGKAVRRTLRRVVVGALLTALPAYRLTAWQCPDGTPPPCRTPVRAAAAAAATPDPGRIAILPFRITGADSVLSEGIAELLAAEFTGERGPRAVHMGSVIRAWRQAGGGAHLPLTQPASVRAARQVGAGLFVDGSIVGLGSRLTVTASVVALDGEVRRAEPIRGSADSLDVLISRLTATLLALAGGESREGSRGVLTASPAAMRSYIEGMSAWRRYRVREAGASLERAFREDSTFARAALMRYWVATWFGQPVVAHWGRIVFAPRERLSSADRILVQALMGERYPTPRLPAVSFADRERAAALLPESPEAQYLAGDYLFHFAGAIDAPDPMERARAYLARSFALDSQQTVLNHLVDATALLGDTALLRSLQPALEARSADMAAASWLVAGYLGDRAWLARLRAQAPATETRGMFEALALLPAHLADEFADRLPSGQGGIMGEPPLRVLLADMQGRPEASRRAKAVLPGSEVLFHMAIVAAMVGERDSADGAEAVRQWTAMDGLDSVQAARRDCHVALWHAWRGVDDATALPELPAMLSCRTMVELLRARRAAAPDMAARLEAADSVVRRRIGFGVYQGYENVVLAHVWESQGNKRRALSAIRLYPIGMAFGVGYRLREEGRLAAELRQIDRAIQAYRVYLDLRKDAEPALRAERDSVRAAIARLVRQ